MPHSLTIRFYKAARSASLPPRAALELARNLAMMSMLLTQEESAEMIDDAIKARLRPRTGAAPTLHPESIEALRAALVSVATTEAA